MAAEVVPAITTGGTIEVIEGGMGADVIETNASRPKDTGEGDCQMGRTAKVHSSLRHCQHRPAQAAARPPLQRALRRRSLPVTSYYPAPVEW